MTFNEYQQTSKQFLKNLSFDKLEYYALGLAGETGETIDEIKKMIRDDGGNLTEERKEKLLSEIGDVLWYLAQMASVINVPLSTIAEKNIEKLNKRTQTREQQKTS